MATKLAEFVARNGRQFEEVTRQRNPGETPFKYVLKPVCLWFTERCCYTRFTKVKFLSVLPGSCWTHRLQFISGMTRKCWISGISLQVNNNFYW